MVPVADLESGHQVAWSACSLPEDLDTANSMTPPAGLPLPTLFPVDVDDLISIPVLSASAEPASREAVLMLNQSTLLDRPAHALRIIEQARRMGWRIGISGVGRDAATLALLPLLDPDVIELERSLVDRPHDAANAHVFAAVGAKAERGGGLVMATGVDSPAQRDAALAAGATVGTGTLFDVPDQHRRRGALLREASGVRPFPSHSPSRIIFAAHEPRVATKRVLIDVSHRLESMAHTQLDDVVMIGSFQHVRYFSMAIGRRWERIAAHSALVVALSVEMDSEPAAGVRGVRLDRSDPLIHEWDLVVLTAHFAAVLVAHDLGDRGPDLDRRFEYAITYRRELAADVARSMMTRVPGELS